MANDGFTVDLEQIMKPATRTVQQTCEFTGLSKSTVYNLVNAKRLDIRKVGKRTLITNASIEKLLGLETEAA